MLVMRPLLSRLTLKNESINRHKAPGFVKLYLRRKRTERTRLCVQLTRDAPSFPAISY